MDKNALRREILYRRVAYISIGFVYPVSFLLLSGKIQAGIFFMIVWDVLWFFITPILAKEGLKIKRKTALGMGLEGEERK